MRLNDAPNAIGCSEISQLIGSSALELVGSCALESYDDIEL